MSSQHPDQMEEGKALSVVPGLHQIERTARSLLRGMTVAPPTLRGMVMKPPTATANPTKQTIRIMMTPPSPREDVACQRQRQTRRNIKHQSPRQSTPPSPLI
ncbi:hypothetical protein PIB30_015497 [Stylosanthes scabra]|uniref:Uncharacterized protein n=1 Tax=Stylosanthes scabra TaxID=79078 RepID=A0ABU6X7W0_9FABA|nr:hypothetical protein [Stylosanthes scabra]